MIQVYKNYKRVLNANHTLYRLTLRFLIKHTAVTRSMCHVLGNKTPMYVWKSYRNYITVLKHTTSFNVLVCSEMYEPLEQYVRTFNPK